MRGSRYVGRGETDAGRLSRPELEGSTKSSINGARMLELGDAELTGRGVRMSLGSRDDAWEKAKNRGSGQSRNFRSYETNGQVFGW